MHGERRLHAAVLNARAWLRGLAWLTAWLAVCSTARAEESETPESVPRVTDDTAHTLPAAHFRVGLWRADYAPFDDVDVGTYWWMWALRVANAQMKWRWFREGPWALASKASAFHIDAGNLELLDQHLGTGTLSIASFEMLASSRCSDRVTASVAAVYTNVWVDGEINVDAFDGTAAGAVSNLQLTTTEEFRLTPATALVLHARYLVFQHLHGRGYVRLDPNEYTSIEIHGGGRRDAFDFPHAWSVVPSVLWTWGILRVRAGVGYGHWSVPGLQFVRKERSWIPELDAYVVF
jgi:hypothetical protein